MNTAKLEVEFILRALKILTRCVEELSSLAKEIQDGVIEGDQAYKVNIKGKKI